MEATTFLLEVLAHKWWRSVSAQLIHDQGNALWADFCRLFRQLHFPPALFQAKAIELLNLKQGTMSIDEYQLKFIDLLPYCPHIGTSCEATYDHFLQGLSQEIFDGVTVCDDPTSYEGQVFALNQEQTQADSERMIAGTFNFLINTGASHSFISARFFKRFRLPYVPLDVLVDVSTPMGQEFLAKNLVLGCVLSFQDHQLSAKLMVLAMDDFHCIIGIDLLTTYRTLVDCYQKFVKFRPEGEDAWYFYGEGARPPLPVIFALKACRVLEFGREGYLIYMIDASLEDPDIQEILVVREFLEVLPDEIPSLPPMRDVGFDIELLPGTSPIS
ncbi:uncharacterized protein [Henckelia pumila]|uniref:uncharacterized protein n=1 Tax=Henckelia pumila TaxID=405737 RepID=UPI003C6E50E7